MGLSELERDADALIYEYLLQKGFQQTADALKTAFVGQGKQIPVVDLSSNGNTEGTKILKVTGLQALVEQSCKKTTGDGERVRRKSSSTADTTRADDDWSAKEVTKLKKAVKEITQAAFSDKNERWLQISKLVESKSKSQCHKKYKELLSEKKRNSTTGASDTEGGQSALKKGVEETQAVTLTSASESQTPDTGDRDTAGARGHMRQERILNGNRHSKPHPVSEEKKDVDDDGDGIEIEMHTGRGGRRLELRENDSQKELHPTESSNQPKGLPRRKQTFLMSPADEEEPAKGKPADSKEDATSGGAWGQGQMRTVPTGPKTTETKPEAGPGGKPSKKAILGSRENSGTGTSIALEDCADLDGDAVESSGTDVPVNKEQALPQNATRLSVEDTRKLRRLFFGDEKKTFGEGWRQGLFFSGTKGLSYGLVQKKGGPCGALAAIQAFILKRILFDGQGSGSISTWQQVLPEQRNQALLHSLASILWTAGNDRRCVTALQGRESTERIVGYTPDGITEKLVCIEHFTYRSVLTFFEQNHAQYTNPTGLGVILFVYSLALSRGLDQVLADFDTSISTPSLIGEHSYCAQEMVNLLLTGRAVGNIFNGTKVLEDSTGSGSKDQITLKGIDSRSGVGFLTLFEAYDYVEAGTYYKDPKYPIWVICSESHYSVIFSSDRQLVSSTSQKNGGIDDKQKFDLYYYDELGNQSQTIKLTIDTQPAVPPPTSKDTKELIPPIDLVIRTKWKGATVDWNDSEPLL